MRLRSPSPSPRVCSPLDCASAISTVTSRSARARISCERWLPSARNSAASRGRALGLHALVDRLAVLLRQVGAPDAHVDHRDPEGLRLVLELGAHLPHELGAL